MAVGCVAFCSVAGFGLELLSGVSGAVAVGCGLEREKAVWLYKLVVDFFSVAGRDWPEMWLKINTFL